MQRLLPLCALAVATGMLACMASPAAAQSSYWNGFYEGQGAGLTLGLMQQEFDRTMEQERERNREYQDRREREDRGLFDVPMGGMGNAEYQVTIQWLLKCFGPAFDPDDLSVKANKRRNDCMSSEETKHAGELAAARAADDARRECSGEFGYKPRNCP